MNPFSNGRPNLSASERIRNKRASTIYNAASRAFNPVGVAHKGWNGAPCRNYNGNIGFYRYGRLRNATNYRLLDDLNRGYALCRDCPDCPGGVPRGVKCPRTYNIGPTMGLSSFLYYFGGGGKLGIRDTVITTYSCTGGHGSVGYTGATGICNLGASGINSWTGAATGLYNNNEITMPFNSEGVGVVIDPSNNLQSVSCTSKRSLDGRYLKLISVEQGLQIKGFLQPFVGGLTPVTGQPFPFTLAGFGPIGEFQTCHQLQQALNTTTPPSTATPPYSTTDIGTWIATWKGSNFAMGSGAGADTMKGWRVVAGGMWGTIANRFGLRGVGTLTNDPVTCCTDIVTPAASYPVPVPPPSTPGPTAGQVTAYIKVFAQHFYERNDVGNFVGVTPDTIGIWIINPLSLSLGYPLIFGYTLGLSPGNLNGFLTSGTTNPLQYYASSSLGGDNGSEKLYPFWNYKLEYTGKALCGPNLTTGNDLQHSYLTCLGNPGKVAFAIPLQGCCGAGATGCDGFLQATSPDATRS